MNINNNNNIEDDDEKDNVVLRANEPLSAGASISVTESMLSILTLLVNHNLTMTSVEDIIRVIHLHCPSQDLIKNSSFKFKKFFNLEQENEIFDKHFYCSTCERELESRDQNCPSCQGRKNFYFITMPIQIQLKELFNRDGFIELLQHRFQRPVNNDAIADIYDGSIYKNWINNGFLLNPHNISFSWYTDGIPVFKSSQISMTPFFLSINELPFSERKLRENTLLLGLWFGKSKPNPNLFMSKFENQFTELAEGINITLLNRVEPIQVRGVLLTGTADTPAKSDFLNFKKFNGAFECMACCIEGENTETENGSTHVYPYEEQLTLRTSVNCINWSQAATEENPIFGVKGPTALANYMPDFIGGMAIDRMHCVDGGIIKKILSLLFDSQYRDEGFSLYHMIETVDARLMTIKPTKFIHRMTRSISEVIHWKASELRVWAFYYSLPVLEGILRPDLFENYKFLIVGCAILSFNEITIDLIAAAEEFLNKFTKDFEALYGLRHCSINIHQVRHLPDCVRRLGPSWSNTCYEQENLNGLLLKAIHGTNHIDSQVAKSHIRNIRKIKFIQGIPDGDILDFCLSRKKQVKIIEPIGPGSYSVGTYKYFDEIPPNLIEMLNEENMGNITKEFYYLRLLKDKKLYVSRLYPKELQTRSDGISYSINNNCNLGLIEYFIKVQFCNCRRQVCGCNGLHYAVTQEVVTEELFTASTDNFMFNTLGYLHRASPTQRFLLVPIININCVCIVINFEDKMYFGLPLNNYELE